MKIDMTMMEHCFYSSIDPTKKKAIIDSAKTPMPNAPANMHREPVIVEFKPGCQVEKLKF